MIGNKVEKSDLIGQIADFPIEIVQRMVDEQVRQGNKASVTIFSNFKYRGQNSGGFTWNDSPEGHEFWTKIISLKQFDVFFEKYPKLNNMQEEKSLKIQIPEGYEIDEERSTFTDIKFKPINKYPDSWDEAFTGKPFNGYIAYEDVVEEVDTKDLFERDNKDVFKTKTQGESSLAYSQLTQLMALPCYNGDWVPDYNDGELKHTIIRYKNYLEKESTFGSFTFLAFKTEEIMNVFYQKYKPLIKTFYQIK